MGISFLNIFFISAKATSKIIDLQDYKRGSLILFPQGPPKRGLLRMNLNFLEYFLKDLQNYKQDI